MLSREVINVQVGFRVIFFDPLICQFIQAGQAGNQVCLLHSHSGFLSDYYTVVASRLVRHSGRCSLLNMVSTTLGYANMFISQQRYSSIFVSQLVLSIKTYRGNDPLQLERVCWIRQWKFCIQTHGFVCVEQAGVYFDEITGGSDETTRYVPRSVQIDLEAGVCNAVSSGVFFGLNGLKRF